MTGATTIALATPTLVSLTQVGAGGVVYQYDVSGVGITFGLLGGNPVLTGGTLTGMTVTQAGALQMTVTGLGLPAVVLQAAMTQERTGVDITAVETLFLNLAWTYHGNANADILLSTDISSDGVPLNLAGNDSFATGGGNDRIFLGDGNDTAHGGTGSDRLDGSNGADKLFGDSGNDSLSGGAQNDQLNGGSGVDTLLGGSGRDKLTGGTGDDWLTGNSGGDTFVFVPGDGGDQITDFDLVNDRIDLAPGAFSFTDFGGTALLHYGGADSVLLMGVAFIDAGLVTII